MNGTLRAFRFVSLSAVVGSTMLTACSLAFDLSGYSGGDGGHDGATVTLDSGFDAAGDAILDDGSDDTSTPADSSSDVVDDVTTPDSGDDTSDSATTDSAVGDSATMDSGVADSIVADSGISDTSVSDSGAADTGVLDSGIADTGVADTGVVDTGVADTGIADTGIADTGVADTGVADSGATDSGATDASDGGGCAVVGGFGVSELMVRAISGMGDGHEWLELTNYTSCALDVSGVTVQVLETGSTFVRGQLTFPSGTVLAAGEAVVVADAVTTFETDAPAVPATQVFGFAAGGSGTDVLVNSKAIIITLTAASGGAPYESITVPVPAGGWPLGQSYAYPVPSMSCPASGRIVGGAPSGTWKYTSPTPGNEFALISTVPEYGSPAAANTSIACP